MKATTRTATVRKTVAVSEANIRKSAKRLLPVGEIVSTEVQYLQRTLSGSVSQEQLDESILAVRKLPWSEIALPE